MHEPDYETMHEIMCTKSWKKPTSMLRTASDQKKTGGSILMMTEMRSNHAPTYRKLEPYE